MSAPRPYPSRVCAWCECVLEEGASNAVSHGICTACQERFLRAVEAVVGRR
ncbi:MAG: hypothetical protein U5Q44_11600 [Dehalococcoidia bacterium]|nr:hypothetical protein [Dehalococcoidia bacterium]